VSTDDILSRSAADIVTLYRSKRLSPVDVLTAMLDALGTDGAVCPTDR
jgi:hypothetical protein